VLADPSDQACPRNAGPSCPSQVHARRAPEPRVSRPRAAARWSCWWRRSNLLNRTNVTEVNGVVRYRRRTRARRSPPTGSGCAARRPAAGTARRPACGSMIARPTPLLPREGGGR
jgi:hypothetical protein